MSIERTQSLKPLNPVQPRETAELAQPKAKASTQQASGGDSQLQLSSMQTQLTQPTATDIDLQRVEELKLAIRNGELQMDTGKIADALLRDAQDLLRG